MTQRRKHLPLLKAAKELEQNVLSTKSKEEGRTYTAVVEGLVECKQNETFTEVGVDPHNDKRTLFIVTKQCKTPPIKRMKEQNGMEHFERNSLGQQVPSIPEGEVFVFHDKKSYKVVENEFSIPGLLSANGMNGKKIMYDPELVEKEENEKFKALIDLLQKCERYFVNKGSLLVVIPRTESGDNQALALRERLTENVLVPELAKNFINKETRSSAEIIYFSEFGKKVYPLEVLKGDYNHFANIINDVHPKIINNKNHKERLKIIHDIALVFHSLGIQKIPDEIPSSYESRLLEPVDIYYTSTEEKLKDKKALVNICYKEDPTRWKLLYFHFEYHTSEGNKDDMYTDFLVAFDADVVCISFCTQSLLTTIKEKLDTLYLIHNVNTETQFAVMKLHHCILVKKRSFPKLNNSDFHDETDFTFVQLSGLRIVNCFKESIPHEQTNLTEIVCYAKGQLRSFFFFKNIDLNEKDEKIEVRGLPDKPYKAASFQGNEKMNPIALLFENPIP